MSNNPYAVPGNVHPLNHPQVAAKRIELDYQERARQDQRADKLYERALSEKSASPDVWTQASEMAERRADDARSAAAESVANIRQLSNRLQKQLEERDDELRLLRKEKDDEVNALRLEVFTIRQDSAMRSQTQETERIRELKGQNEREMARIKEDHASKVTSLAQQHHLTITEANSRHERERTNMNESQERERSRVLETNERREAQLIGDHKSREETLVTMYEGRLSEAHRAAEREVRTYKDSAQQQLQSVQLMEGAKSQAAERTSDMQVNLMTQTLARLETQNEMLQRDNEELRRSTRKEPLEAIEEAKRLVELTGGGAIDDGDMDWKKGLVQVIRGGMDRLPEIAKGFGDAREQNRQLEQQAAARQMQQQHQRQQAQHAQMHPPAMAAAAAQSGRREAYRQPPPQVSQQHAAPSMTAVDQPPPMTAAPPLGSGAPRSSTDAPLAGGVPLVPSHPMSPIQPFDMDVPPAPAPAPAQAPPPVDGMNMHPLANVMGVPPVPPAVQQQPPGTAPASQQEAVQELAQRIPAEAIIEFTNELETAIQGEMVPEAVFAEGFVSRVGPDTARSIIDAVNAQDFIDGVIAGGGGMSPIVSRKGKRYTRSLWGEVRKLV